MPDILLTFVVFTCLCVGGSQYPATCHRAEMFAVASLVSQPLSCWPALSHTSVSPFLYTSCGENRVFLFLMFCFLCFFLSFFLMFLSLLMSSVPSCPGTSPSQTRGSTCPPLRRKSPLEDRQRQPSMGDVRPGGAGRGLLRAHGVAIPQRQLPGESWANFF